MRPKYRETVSIEDVKGYCSLFKITRHVFMEEEEIASIENFCTYDHKVNRFASIDTPTSLPSKK